MGFCSVCDCFCNMPRMEKAVFLTRLLWPISFGFLWIGVIPNGWQTATSGSLSASYGLWHVKYFGGGSAYTAAYQQWSDAQESAEPYSRLQGVRACVVFGIVFGAIQFLASLRAYCTRTPELKNRYLSVTAASSAITLAFTILALAVWHSIPDTAFKVFCSTSGCATVTGDFKTALGYSWGFFVLKAAAEGLATPILFYIVCATASLYSAAASSLNPELPTAVATKAPAAGGAAAGGDDDSEPSPSRWSFWSKNKGAGGAQQLGDDAYQPPAPTAPNAAPVEKDFSKVGPSADGTPSWLNP